MSDIHRKPSFVAIAFLLGLVGGLFCFVGITLDARAQGARAIQVWPDRSAGVSSGPLEGATIPTATQVLPFGTFRTSEGDVVRARTYFHFPLGVFPPNTEIRRATLYVYVDTGSGTDAAMMGAYRVLESWREEEVNDDSSTWPTLLASPIAVAPVRFGAAPSLLPVATSTAAATSSPTVAPTGSPIATLTATLTATATPTSPVVTDTPVLTPTPTLTTTDEPDLSSKPAGHGLLQGTRVSIEPAEAQVTVGSRTEVGIYVEEVIDLYSAEIYLTFDPALLEVMDADPDAEDVQIQAGRFLPADVVTQNVVFQDSGEIYFLISQDASDTPISGSGMLATITFQGKAMGTSVLGLESVSLFGPNQRLINASSQDGRVTVSDEESLADPTPTSESTRSSPLPTPSPLSSPMPTSTPRAAFVGQAVSLGPVAGSWLSWDVTVLMRAWMRGDIPADGLALASVPDPDAEPEATGNLLVAHWPVAKETRPYIIAEFVIQPPTPTSVATPGPILPPAGHAAGWKGVGLLLVGIALLMLGLVVRRKNRLIRGDQ